jgi:hypothetical protein
MDDFDQSDLPELADEQFPPFVHGEADRLRFRASVAVARAIFGDDGEAQVWAASRVIFNSEIPTMPAARDQDSAAG